MKKLIVLLMLCLSLTSCTTSNRAGKCVGVMSKENKIPNKEYSMSGWNVFLSVLFAETLIVPGVVVFYYLECPVEN